MPIWLLNPTVIIGLVGGLAFGGFWLQDHFEDRGFKNEIARLSQQLRDEIQANGKLQDGVETANKSIKTLQDEITNMNGRLVAMDARARQIESAANLRVIRARREGEAAAQALRSPETRVMPGHDAMNTWLKETFGS